MKIIALLVVLLICSVGLSSATSTYNVSTNIITVEGTLNNLSSIAANISNATAFSWNATTKAAITNADIHIPNDALPPTNNLTIYDSTLKFNGSYKLHSDAILLIDNSTITSINTTDGMRGRIYVAGQNKANSIIFKIMNSSLSHLGSSTPAESGIFTYTIDTYSDRTVEPIIIDNNDFNDVKSIRITQGSDNAFVTNNVFHDVSTNMGIEINCYFANNTIRNYGFNYNVMSYVPLNKNPVIINNTWENVEGMGIILKQGSGGAYVGGNHFYNITGSGAIKDAGSVRTSWNVIENNVIQNVYASGGTGNGYGFLVYGDFHESDPIDNRSCKVIFRDNIITNASTGIFIDDVSFFEGSSALIDAFIQNNTVTESISHAFRIDGNPITNVTIIDNSFYNNANDIYLSSTAGNQSPYFINTNYSSTSIIAGLLYDYKYLDVKVVDNSSTPILGATITILNNINNSFPSINLTLDEKTIFTTLSDGHTPLPINNFSISIAVLDFWKSSTAQENMTYNLTASHLLYLPNTTTITPLNAWFRFEPNIYQNTTIILMNQWNAIQNKLYVGTLCRINKNGITFIGTPTQNNESNLKVVI